MSNRSSMNLSIHEQLADDVFATRQAMVMDEILIEDAGAEGERLLAMEIQQEKDRDHLERFWTERCELE